MNVNSGYNFSFGKIGLISVILGFFYTAATTCTICNNVLENLLHRIQTNRERQKNLSVVKLLACVDMLRIFCTLPISYSLRGKVAASRKFSSNKNRSFLPSGMGMSSRFVLSVKFFESFPVRCGMKINRAVVKFPETTIGRKLFSLCE